MGVCAHMFVRLLDTKGNVCAGMCGPLRAQKVFLDTYLSHFMYVRCVLPGYRSMCAHVCVPFGCQMQCMCEHAVREVIYVRFAACGVSCVCGVFC